MLLGRASHIICLHVKLSECKYAILEKYSHRFCRWKKSWRKKICCCTLPLQLT